MANTLIVERMTRHQVMIQRLGSGHVRKLLPILERLSQDIRARLQADPTEFQFNRLSAMFADINAMMRSSGAELSDGLFDELIDFAQYEAGFSQRALSDLVTAQMALPAESQVRAALTQARTSLVSGKTVQTLTVRQMVDQFTETKRREIDQIVRAGFIEGRTTDDMARQVRSVVDQKGKRQAEALIRTATNHAGSVAREAFYLENEDVIQEEEWVATLDSRTTILCAGRDGNKYPVGQGPHPPAHYNCRSIRVPRVDPEFTLFGKGSGDRASMDGPVNAQTTYGGWLKKQPKEFQDDVLGPERAKLFRSGEVSIDGFTDDMGRTLTLDELRLREGLTLE